MKYAHGCLLVFAASLSLGLNVPLGHQAFGAETEVTGDLGIQDLVLTIPNGWTKQQDARNDDTLILGFGNGADYVTLFVKAKTAMTMRSIFVNGATVVRDLFSEPHGERIWQKMHTSKTAANRSKIFVASFLMELNGYTYFGYSRSGTVAKAQENVNTFLNNLR